jgi:hypothetical protein
MPFEATTIIEVLCFVIWGCINGQEWINARFHYVFPSQDAVLSLLESLGLVFPPGLLDVVQHSSPPAIAWFEGLPAFIPADSWGVYALVLRKQGCRPKLYVGSGTSNYRGVRARLAEYSNQDKTICKPQRVRHALDDGYRITHKTLLVHCPKPSPGQVPKLRYAIYALEASFTCIFSTIPNGKDNGFRDLYPWPQGKHLFEYDGLCTHNPFLDTVEGDLGLSPEQLEAIAAAVREKNRAYQTVYHKHLARNPTPKYRARQKLNNERQKAGTKARQQKAVADKQEYYCEPCKVACRDHASLVRHQAKPRHQKKLIMGDDDFYCPVCDFSCKYLSRYNQHLQTKEHARNSPNQPS